MEPKSDDLLVEEAKTNPEAFGELYERYVERIYSYVYYRTGRTLDAEDLTEKVFFQALTHLPKYTNRGLPFAAWLFRIAHNLVANWYRDSQRRKQVGLEDLELTQSPAEDVEQAEEKLAIRKAVASLPPLRQHLIVLKYVEEMSNAEIGLVLGRSEGAVKALLHRTLRSLRAIMETEKVGLKADDHSRNLLPQGPQRLR